MVIGYAQTLTMNANDECEAKEDGVINDEDITKDSFTL